MKGSWNKYAAKLYLGPVPRVPKKRVECLRQTFDISAGTSCSSCLAKDNTREEIARAENLIHEFPHMMNILTANLNKHTAAFGKELSRKQQPITEVRQV